LDEHHNKEFADIKQKVY